LLPEMGRDKCRRDAAVILSLRRAESIAVGWASSPSVSRRRAGSPSYGQTSLLRLPDAVDPLFDSGLLVIGEAVRARFVPVAGAAVHGRFQCAVRFLFRSVVPAVGQLQHFGVVVQAAIPDLLLRMGEVAKFGIVALGQKRQAAAPVALEEAAVA